MNHPDILEKLSLEQKCALLSGADMWNTRSFPRQGVPGIRLSDGPHGLRTQIQGDNLGLGESEPATCFPTASALANSWDIHLMQQVGEALGVEAIDHRVNVLLGPGLNVKRSPLCGRNFEYFSEDPYLSGKLAAAYVKGVQSTGVAACPKHFAANNQELRRMSSDSIVDERTLRELYLTAFEIVVRTANPKALMTSYNSLNGTYTNENPHLLREILRDEWGFEGAVITDWGGSNDHVAGVKAGSSLEMPGSGLGTANALLQAVKKGDLSVGDIDLRADEVLTLILGTQTDPGPAYPEYGQRHHDLARTAAAESIVLLKNTANLLPLNPGTKVALIGALARDPNYQGSGSSKVNAVRVESLPEQLEAAGLKLMGYAPGYRLDGQPDEALEREAAALAQKAEVVLLCLGLPPESEAEGLDRKDMSLPLAQKRLLTALRVVNPRIVGLVSAGSPVEMGWNFLCRAVLHGYLSGQAGAAAMAQILVGALNPSGKLAETLPLSLADTPTAENYPSAERASQYREGLFVGYRYYLSAGVPAAYPFGHGVSYTRFSYSNLRVSPNRVTFTITNIGNYAGAEVAQLYVAMPGSRLVRPARELKGFVRVALKPSETITVGLPLDEYAFRYFNTATNRWEVEGGQYQILVGASSTDIRLRENLTVAGTGATLPYSRQMVPAYASGQVKLADDAQWETLLGHPAEKQKRKIDATLTLGELNHTRSPLMWLLWLVLLHFVKKDAKAGKVGAATFAWNMPLRGLAQMTGGIIGMETVQGIVWECRGLWVIGILRALVGLWQNRQVNRRYQKWLQEDEDDPVFEESVPLEP